MTEPNEERDGDGVETRFVNGLDPDPKTRAISRNLPHIHLPETLAAWLAAETLDAWVKRLHADGDGFYTAADDARPASFRARLRTMPPLEHGNSMLGIPADEPASVLLERILDERDATLDQPERSARKAPTGMARS